MTKNILVSQLANKILEKQNKAINALHNQIKEKDKKISDLENKAKQVLTSTGTTGGGI